MISDYAQVRDQILDGDVLLFRSVGLFGRLCDVAGRGRYSHAGLAAWWGKNLMLLETRQWRGARAVLLSSQVQAWPGRIDVYRRHAGRWFVILSQKSHLIDWAVHHTGKPYGFWSLARTALYHAPVIRWFVRPSTTDAGNGRPLYCSAMVARAYREAGIDLVPNLADADTEPDDLARSAELRCVYEGLTL